MEIITMITGISNRKDNRLLVAEAIKMMNGRGL